MYVCMSVTINPGYAFSTKRLVSDTETVIFPGEIIIIPPQIPPTGRSKKGRVTSALGDPEEELEK
ncbi:hypothetical protein E2C01_020609 [Portunus trituberculatus]|uniref:Uncharacterized protein n=1 Tax=Portunus trituberculatus TaxID=210409 RepID=A0A5B7E0L5_PORTR|nr:hypothetical protein [Portunus trituberculatus]